MCYFSESDSRHSPSCTSLSEIQGCSSSHLLCNIHLSRNYLFLFLCYLYFQNLVIGGDGCIFNLALYGLTKQSPCILDSSFTVWLCMVRIKEMKSNQFFALSMSMGIGISIKKIPGVWKRHKNSEIHAKKIGRCESLGWVDGTIFLSIFLWKSFFFHARFIWYPNTCNE